MEYSYALVMLSAAADGDVLSSSSDASVLMARCVGLGFYSTFLSSPYMTARDPLTGVSPGLFKPRKVNQDIPSKRARQTHEHELRSMRASQDRLTLEPEGAGL